MHRSLFPFTNRSVNIAAYTHTLTIVALCAGERGQTAPSGMNFITGAGHAPAVLHTLQTLDPLSDVSPFARGRGLRSRPSSAKSRVSVVSEVSRRSYDGIREGA